MKKENNVCFNQNTTREHLNQYIVNLIPRTVTVTKRMLMTEGKKKHDYGKVIMKALLSSIKKGKG